MNYENKFRGAEFSSEDFYNHWNVYENEEKLNW